MFWLYETIFTSRLSFPSFHGMVKVQSSLFWSTFRTDMNEQSFKLLIRDMMESFRKTPKWILLCQALIPKVTNESSVSSLRYIIYLETFTVCSQLFFYVSNNFKLTDPQFHHCISARVQRWMPGQGDDREGETKEQRKGWWDEKWYKHFILFKCISIQHIFCFTLPPDENCWWSSTNIKTKCVVFVTVVVCIAIPSGYFCLKHFLGH